jgi:uncharacterized delta-60 repeat protein
MIVAAIFLVAGNAAFADQLVVDASFGANGVVRDTFTNPVAATLQADGKLLIRGFDANGTVAIVRLDRDGSRDGTFGSNGIATVAAGGKPLTGFGDIAALADGRIVVAGTTDSGTVAAVRLNATGALDSTFGVGGAVGLPRPPAPMPYFKIRAQPDGSTLVLDNASTGGFFPDFGTALDLLNADGTRVVAIDLPCGDLPGHYRNADLGVQPDDKPVLEIDNGVTQCIVRFTPSGALDASFGNAGVFQRTIDSTEGARIVIDPRDPLSRMIVWVGGPANAGTTTRLLPGGNVDPAFTFQSSYSAPFNALPGPAFACAGKFVNAYNVGSEAPQPDLRIVRYNGNGTLDGSFASDGSGQIVEQVADAQVAVAVLVRDDGDLIVVENSAVAATPLTIVAAYRQLDCAEPFDPLSVPVLEYYNASLDHYFMTASIDDLNALDSGRFAGWARTGRTLASAAPAAGGEPVCRFYIPPAFGDSHFFSASSNECAEVAARFPQFILETRDAMHMGLPDPATGACDADTPTAVYRLWDGRADTNHRYTTDAGVRNAMVASGWIAEGYGPDAVAMCARVQ